MNAIAAYYVYDHIDRMREEAARERRARQVASRPSAVSRLRGALASLVTNRSPTAQAGLAV